MELLKCSCCGASEFIKYADYQECVYCGSKYKIEPSPAKSSINPARGIFMEDEVSILLKKCENEPQKASRYANLILDIDPVNKDALKYL